MKILWDIHDGNEQLIKSNIGYDLGSQDDDSNYDSDVEIDWGCCSSLYGCEDDDGNDNGGDNVNDINAERDGMLILLL